MAALQNLVQGVLVAQPQVCALASSLHSIAYVRLQQVSHKDLHALYCADVCKPILLWRTVSTLTFLPTLACLKAASQLTAASCSRTTLPQNTTFCCEAAASQLVMLQQFAAALLAQAERAWC